MKYLNIWIVLMLYLIEYLIAYKLFTDRTVKKPWRMFILVSLSFLIIFFFVPESSDKSFICLYIGFATVIISFLLFSSGSFFQRLKKLFIVFGLCFGIEYLAELIGRIINENSGNNNESYLFNIRVNIIVIVALIIITVIIIYHRNKYIDNNVPLKRVMIIMTGGVFITLLSIDVVISHIENKNTRINMLILAAIFTLCVEGLILLILFLKKIYDHQRKITEQIKEMAQTEKRYFKDLLERESETRKFRHDIKNHFLIIQQLADKYDCKDLSNYLEGINIKRLDEKTNFETGNTKLNALTNYYLSFSGDDTAIDISGIVSDYIGIDEASLCVIYGNLLKNAVEAVNNISSPVKKRIIIELAEGTQYFRIKISNTLKENVLPDFNTQKSDKINHGLGLINVRETVKKMGGVMKYELKDYLLTTEITLPL